MQNRLSAGVVLAVALSTWSHTASADPIHVYGGQLQMDGLSGSLQLVGDRGFTLTAAVGVIDSLFGPWQACNANLTCLPGETVNLNGTFVGSSLRGTTVTLDGETFTNVTSAAARTGAAVWFTGSATAPPLDAETTFIIAPFTFEGFFSYPTGPLSGIQELLVGQGIATISLERTLGGDTGLAPRWRYTSAHYEFDPVPEPATILLTGAGLVALARLRPRRRVARRSGNLS